MPTPVPFPLDDFERATQADPEVLGMFYFGSLGRGTATRFSDLDILVWVGEDLPLGARAKLLHLLSLFGETHWLGGDGNDVHALVGPAWTQVDLRLVRRADLKPDAYYAGARIIKDTDGVLAHMASTCEPEAIVETVESATDVIHGAIGDQLFNARHN